MRHFFHIVMLGLILLLVAVISMLTAMRFAIHGREVAVPGLVGMKDADAEAAAGSLGLRLVVEGRYFSSQYPEGSVMAQSPKPGGRVRRGWVVHVAESLGPQRAVIPNVVGESQRAAEINITRRGLDVGTASVVHIPDLPPGEVVAQSPPAQAQEAVSPKVNLLINAPAESEAYVMPDLVGRRFGEAAQAITALGMHVVVNSPAAAPEVPGRAPQPTPAELDAATIAHQSPAPGQKVSPGATIFLELSR
jgi:beta-lactam-binding protein with PASTA domain